MSRALREGKLDPELLAELLDALPAQDPRVVVKARVGEDAAAIEMGDRCLVAASDPITFTTDRMGWYALHVNANDVATMGAVPKWFLATILLPAGQTTEEMVRSIFTDLAFACRKMDITLCGGHTEVTSAVNRPVIVGQMLGEVKKANLIDGRQMVPGDRIILAGGLAIEGTAIIASGHYDKLVQKGVDRDLLERATQFLDIPGISVLPAARAVMAAGKVHAMHDPTEGGLATACHEMARLAAVGLEIEREKILVLPESQAICTALGIDPLGTLASGALLIGVPENKVSKVLKSLKHDEIPAAEIGRATEDSTRIELIEGGKRRPLPLFTRDEILRAFDE